MRAEGSSGYERLLVHLPSLPPQASVLDLACGDGEWLVRAQHLRPDARLIGIDLCEAELQRARPRLSARVELRCERAQALSLLDASVDAVLCHMALMLMDDADAVANQVRRVLRPSGVFAAVLGTGLDDTPAGLAWRQAMDAAMAADAERPRLRFGDRRTRSAEGLQALFASGFHGHRFEPFTATTEGSPASLWDSLQLSYDPALLSAAGQLRLRDTALAAWHALPAGQPLQLRWRLAEFSCRRDA
jgi:ubiquinone/menaquinone biosynthesis C-methylase UbiE